MAESNGAVRITNREIYDELIKLKDKVADSQRDTAEVKASVHNVDKRLENMESLNLSDHGKRLRALELRFYGILAGLVAALGVLLNVGSK